MHYPARAGRRARHTLCISSQAGCAVGCPFCATGELGFERDLETAEILDQVRSAVARLAHEPARTTRAGHEHRVHGHGRAAAQPRPRPRGRRGAQRPGAARARARGTSRSRPRASCPGIRRLTALGPQFTLAISLHAARDALRDVLVPLNRRWPVAEVVAAARDHARATGRRISYEVTMIGGVNDTDADADAVATLLRGDLAHVNLIPMNPVAHTPWHGQPDARHRAVRGAARGGGHPGHDPAQPRRRRSARRAASSPPSGRGAAPAPAVARRRQRLEAASARALRGERSDEPVPAGVDG